jgi:hypothetical protein
LIKNRNYILRGMSLNIKASPVIGRCWFDSFSDFVIFLSKSFMLVETCQYGYIYFKFICITVDK